MTTKTKDVITDIVSLIRTAQRGDQEAFTMLMPKTLEDAQAMLTTSIALMDCLTSGPNQDRLLNECVQLAEGLGDHEVPEPDAET